MCEQCYVLDQLLEAGKSNTHQNYFPTLMFLNELVKEGNLELYAGDCPIDEVRMHIKSAKHYTIVHYFRCKNCDRIFFVGSCIKGKPTFRTIENISSVNLKNGLWGRCGTYYENECC